MISPPFAYVGPGAGFAFLGSFLSLVLAVLAGIASLLLWPFRMAWSMVRRRRAPGAARVKRAVFLGLDGLDPRVTEKLMAEGKLPNFSRLKEQGSYTRLRTTFPALSPVAWSTFATGVNPAKHNIFDFLSRDLRSYAPELSSAKVHPPRRVLRFGKWRIPLSRPSIEMRRKSEPFWKILSRYAVPSTIIRVPVTFPPDEFDGRMLSAMSTPDLQGTQGTFSLFTTNKGLIPVEGSFEGGLRGPVDAEPLGFMLRSHPVALEIQGRTYPLIPGEYTPWIRLKFGAVHGIARFLLTRPAPDIALYVTPVQMDPERPALPISQPGYYAAYLAKLLGAFSTLGMAEDTSALNEGAIDHAAFLKQARLIQAEREAMFFSALEHQPRGVVACVFDTSDRVQHMFHGDPEVIEHLYRDMDRIVGKTMDQAGADTALFVLSDHGFCSFRRGVNLNTWLRDNGYLAEKDSEIDWARTRAWAVGLGGLYLNLCGREGQGIVEPKDADALKTELVSKLTGLTDEETGDLAILQAYAASDIYKGPYLEAAPDLIIGYADGYRTSWDAALGKLAARVFEDNTKPWCGDHCVDPHLVPGVLFSNRKIDAEGPVKRDPGIEDMAATALALFGIKPPGWMEGRSVISFA